MAPFKFRNKMTSNRNVAKAAAAVAGGARNPAVMKLTSKTKAHFLATSSLTRSVCTCCKPCGVARKTRLLVLFHLRTKKCFSATCFIWLFRTLSNPTTMEMSSNFRLNLLKNLLWSSLPSLAVSPRRARIQPWSKSYRILSLLMATQFRCPKRHRPEPSTTLPPALLPLSVPGSRSSTNRSVASPTLRPNKTPFTSCSKVPTQLFCRCSTNRTTRIKLSTTNIATSCTTKFPGSLPMVSVF
mmetsp:Transcript_1944/g.2576  ORF Transcript_1944/g.2576 Transcript_1944/m.2576 type:complete len:241 (+) Transcript_1944:1679-2401(+)